MHFTRLSGTLVVVAALILSLTSNATAAPRTSTVSLTVEAQTGAPVTVTLRCNPTGGTHPQAAQACAQLTAAGGNFDRIQPLDVMCTLEYNPVTAKARGTWNGRVVRWQKQFGNACALTAATNAVFAF